MHFQIYLFPVAFLLGVMLLTYYGILTYDYRLFQVKCLISYLTIFACALHVIILLIIVLHIFAAHTSSVRS